MKEEIISNSNWTKDDQIEFWKVVNRKRDKLEPIKIKAHALMKINALEEAVTLLNHFIVEFQNDPDQVLGKAKYRSLFREDLVKLAFQIIENYLKFDKPKEAEQFCETGEHIFYFVSKNEEVHIELSKNLTHFSTKYEGYLLLADYYLTRNELSKANEFLNKHYTCSPDFKLFGYGLGYSSYVEYSRKTGDFSKPKFIREKCYPSFEVYINDNKSSYKDIASGEMVSVIDLISENFYVGYHAVCPNLHHKNKQSLREIDQAFANTAPVHGENYDLESMNYGFMHDYLLPELGAYLGEFLCNELNAEWTQNTELLRSTVKINDKIVNPFALAYDVIFHQYRLVEEIFLHLESS